MKRIVFPAALYFCAVFSIGATGSRAALAEGEPPQPHFASLKADEVHVRKGPGDEYDVLWTYHSLGLPVEVTAEHDHWRRIRDSEGAEGWVYFRLLSALRSALITPWDKSKETTPLRDDDSDGARLVARLESGVKVFVQQCNGSWCQVSVSSMLGWIPQNRLWGIYPGEKFK
jgi:SH3-like domain-containing protein